MSHAKPAPRTYNQTHAPRKYITGRRRVSVYISWSHPGEVNQDLTVLDNRFATITESRRAYWPELEWANPMTFQQGIAGTLELFFRTWMPFQQLVEEATGYAVPVFQRGRLPREGGGVTRSGHLGRLHPSERPRGLPRRGVAEQHAQLSEAPMQT